jgi:ribosomal protein S27E
MTHAYVTCGTCHTRRFIYREERTPIGARVYCPKCKKMITPAKERRTDGEHMETPLRKTAPLKYKKPKPKNGPAKKNPYTEQRTQRHLTDTIPPPARHDTIGVIEYPERSLAIDLICQECHHARILHRRHSFGWVCKECPCEILDHAEARRRKEEAER